MLLLLTRTRTLYSRFLKVVLKEKRFLIGFHVIQDMSGKQKRMGSSEQTSKSGRYLYSTTDGNCTEYKKDRSSPR